MAQSSILNFTVGTSDSTADTSSEMSEKTQTSACIKDTTDESTRQENTQLAPNSQLGANRQPGDESSPNLGSNSARGRQGQTESTPWNMHPAWGQADILGGIMAQQTEMLKAITALHTNNNDTSRGNSRAGEDMGPPLRRAREHSIASHDLSDSEGMSEEECIDNPPIDPVTSF